MIIISSGFPKSASTLLFLYVEHLLNCSGSSRGQRLFRKYNNTGFVPHIGLARALWLLLLSLFGPVVVKTHCGPTFFVRLLVKSGLGVAYYSVRDPRDVVLSAMDHAAKARSLKVLSDADQAFAPFHTWDDLFPALEMHFRRYSAWKTFKQILFVRYEDLLRNPVYTLQEVTKHIHRKELNQFIDQSVEWFSARKAETTHYNTGKSERFSKELSAEQISTLETELKESILAMGYKLTGA